MTHNSNNPSRSWVVVSDVLFYRHDLMGLSPLIEDAGLFTYDEVAHLDRMDGFEVCHFSEFERDIKSSLKRIGKLEALVERLRKDKPSRNSVTRKVRQSVNGRFSNHCYFCGVEMVSEYECETRMTRGASWPTVDHIIPVSHNGTNSKANLVAACESCNVVRRSIPFDWFRRFRRGLLDVWPPGTRPHDTVREHLDWYFHTRHIGKPCPSGSSSTARG